MIALPGLPVAEFLFLERTACFFREEDMSPVYGFKFFYDRQSNPIILHFTIPAAVYIELRVLYPWQGILV